MTYSLDKGECILLNGKPDCHVRTSDISFILDSMTSSEYDEFCLLGFVKIYTEAGDTGVLYVPEMKAEAINLALNTIIATVADLQAAHDKKLESHREMYRNIRKLSS